ncbi:hypothetical protein ASE14_09530 [Agromyces sp. Root81]|uniref:DUF6630 family protein n=1 Tax=Agromyces sp. Root81 TaxID=1736601 RepID=UPI0006FD3F86|nr:hypothetical protein [Agromyces sp. Root81]KRC61159.1 hypothetical protein ASE14_09530 [Agromyces sp. Root81]
METYRNFLAPAEHGIDLGTSDPAAELHRHGIVEVVDWSGESEPGQIVQFVARRLAVFGVEPGTIDAVHAAADATAESDLERGEHVPVVLRAIDEALGATDVALGELRRGDDAYWVGVMPRTEASVEAWGLDRPAQEFLYIIDCPCGGMNIWQLPTDSPQPDEGECNSCERELFEASGTPIAPMIVEPV